MKISEIEKKLNYADRYYEICLKYSDYKRRPSVKPSKKEMLAIFQDLGYNVKYYSGERIFIERHEIDVYSYEYFFEFNGYSPLVFLYVKKDDKSWPIQRYFPGLDYLKRKYPRSEQEPFVGYFAFPTNLNEIKAFLKNLKPLLDELRLEVLAQIGNSEFNFQVDG